MINMLSKAEKESHNYDEQVARMIDLVYPKSRPEHKNE